MMMIAPASTNCFHIGNGTYNFVIAVVVTKCSLWIYGKSVFHKNQSFHPIFVFIPNNPVSVAFYRNYQSLSKTYKNRLLTENPHKNCHCPLSFTICDYSLVQIASSLSRATRMVYDHL
jgi:hypothetical protein